MRDSRITLGAYFDSPIRAKRAADSKIRQKSSQLPKQDATLATYNEPETPGN
jgi:hypothetical protein